MADKKLFKQYNDPADLEAAKKVFLNTWKEIKGFNITKVRDG